MGLAKKQIDHEKWGLAKDLGMIPSSQQENDEVELDVIERFKSNMVVLDDLQQRLGFMNNEIEALVVGTKKIS